MKRLIRGMFGLSLAAGLTACDNDPSLDFGGEPTMVQASPNVMFVNQGATKEVLVRLVNDRNQSVPAKFDVSNVGSGISVALDENYRPNNIDGYLVVPEIKEQHRYYVTANEPTATTFTLSNGSLSTQVQVIVIPSEIPVTYSAVSGNTVTITSENFTFDMATTFTFGANAAQSPLSVSADGHSATIIVPGAQSAVQPTIAGARASYMPTIGLAAIPASEPLTTPVGTYATPGFPNPTTFALPEGTFTFSEVGDITGPDLTGDGGPNAWYRFTVATDRHIDITLSWAGGNDLDWFLYDSDGNTLALAAAGGAGPEHSSADVTAGTYDLVVVNWNSTTPPTFWKFVITP